MSKHTSRANSYIDAYDKLAALYSDHVLLYQTGTTVRAFGASARAVSKHTGHALTSAPPGSGYTTMATFPEPLRMGVIAALVEAGQRVAYVGPDGDLARFPASATDLATRLKSALALNLPHVRVMEVSASPSEFYVSDFPDKAQAIDAVEALGGQILARIVGDDNRMTLKVRVPDAWLKTLPDAAANVVSAAVTAPADGMAERLRALEQERDRLLKAVSDLERRADDLARINDHQSRMLAEASAPTPTALSVEVVTLVLHIHTPETRRVSDRKLAEHLADGWTVLDSDYSFDGSGAPLVHVVTLKRRRQDEQDVPPLDVRAAVEMPTDAPAAAPVVDVPVDDGDTQELPVTVPGRVHMPDVIYLDGGVAPRAETSDPGACPRWLSDLVGDVAEQPDAFLTRIWREGSEATREDLNAQVQGKFIETYLSAPVNAKPEPPESFKNWLARRKAEQATLASGPSDTPVQ